MKYKHKKAAKKLVRGSVWIKTNYQDFSQVLAKVYETLNEFYLKTVEWKRDNPHTSICIQEQVYMFPTMASDMPLCCMPNKAVVISSAMNPFSSVDVHTWKENFEATVHALAEAFGQEEVCIEYTKIEEVAVFEAVAERV